MVKTINFLLFFGLLFSRTLTHPNEIHMVCSHTLTRLPRKIAAGSAHRGPNNRPHRRATHAKNGENRRFLTVFQPLRLCTSPHRNEIRIISSHTLVC